MNMVEDKDYQESLRKKMNQLFEQIHSKSKENRDQIKTLLQKTSQAIDDPIMLQLMASNIADYVKILVHNDQLLIKLVGIISKYLQRRDVPLSSDKDLLSLTQKEKDQLFKNAIEEVQGQSQQLRTALLKKVKYNEKDIEQVQ